MERLKEQIFQDVQDRIRFLVTANIDEIKFYRREKYALAKVTVKQRCKEMKVYYCYKKEGKKYNLIAYTLSLKEAKELILKDY